MSISLYSQRASMIYGGFAEDLIFEGACLLDTKFRKRNFEIIISFF